MTLDELKKKAERMAMKSDDCISYMDCAEFIDMAYKLGQQDALVNASIAVSRFRGAKSDIGALFDAGWGEVVSRIIYAIDDLRASLN
jgi:hypothetical protein